MNTISQLIALVRTNHNLQVALMCAAFVASFSPLAAALTVGLALVLVGHQEGVLHGDDDDQQTAASLTHA